MKFKLRQHEPEMSTGDLWTHLMFFNDDDGIGVRVAIKEPYTKELAVTMLRHFADVIEDPDRFPPVKKAKKEKKS